MREQIATKPKLVAGPVWYIYFRAWHPDRNKMMLKKIYKGFNDCIDDKQRLTHGKKLCNEYEQKLRSGWSPWQSDEVIYNDNIAYHNKTKITGIRKKSSRTIRFYLSDFLEWKKATVKKKTMQSYTSKLRAFCHWLEEKGYDKMDIGYINQKLVAEFFDFIVKGRGLDRRTVEKYRQNISDFFNWLLRNKKIEANPVFDIQLPKQRQDKAARPIPSIDLKRLLSVIQEEDKQLFLACMFQYYCFLRPSFELRYLKIKDIDFDNGKVRINQVDAKNSKAQTIQMPRQLVDLCRDVCQLQMFNPDFFVFGNKRMPGEKAYGQNTLRNRFNEFRKKLGLPDIYKFYSLKHTGAGNLLESGATLVELMDQLRHNELNTTYHYIKRHYGSKSSHIQDHFPNPLE